MHGIHYYIVNIPDIEIYFKVILKIKHWTCIIYNNHKQNQLCYRHTGSGIVITNKLNVIKLLFLAPVIREIFVSK